MGWIATAFAQEAAGKEAAGHEAAAHAETIPWDVITFQAFNVAIFLAVLIWLARRPIGDALKNRALGVRKQIEEAQRQKEEAEARYAEIESRLVSLDRRVEDMRAEAEAEAVHEADRIRERGHQDAARIQETAERTIREETSRARHELRGEAAALAVQLARETLKRAVTPADQERLARDFLAAVERDRNSSNGGTHG